MPNAPVEAAARERHSKSNDLTTMKTTDEKLAAISERLRTQDNRCTANPMFIVQQQRSFGCEPGEGDTDVWLDEDWEEVSEEMSAKLDELDGAFEWELEEDQAAMLKRHTKRGIKHHWDFVMAAFTEEGCKEYLGSMATISPTRESTP